MVVQHCARNGVQVYAPALWEEIGGFAEGLNITMEQSVACFGNDGLRMPTGGCSAVMSGGGMAATTISGRAATRRASRWFRCAAATPASAAATSSPAAGRHERARARIGLHLVKARPRRPALSALLVRRVLDSCATTAEAIDLLRRLPHAMQYNYSLLDAGGVAAVVEAGAGAVAVRGGDWLACTNHFQSPQLRRLNRRVAHSIGRLPPLEGWAARELSAEQTFMALNFSVSPAFHNYGNAQTLHTMVAEPAKRRLLIGIGGDAAALEEDMLDVDFNRWVAGEDLPIKQLKGQLSLGLQPFRRTKARL